MTDNDTKAHEKLQRRFFRKNVHRIWEMVKSGRRNELSEIDNSLALIIMDHQEYSDHFENTDILDGREYDAGTQFNPFLHISTHKMVEDQLSADSPVETSLFCDAMEEKGLSRHDAVHFIIVILLHVLSPSAANRQSFDKARYRRLLNVCREVEPSEIEGVIETEFSAGSYRRGLH
jgi:hypothetical protein